MRRRGAIAVSSVRRVCVFCASQSVAAPPIHASRRFAFTQRQRLHSSCSRGQSFASQSDVPHNDQSESQRSFGRPVFGSSNPRPGQRQQSGQTTFGRPAFGRPNFGSTPEIQEENSVGKGEGGDAAEEFARSPEASGENGYGGSKGSSGSNNWDQGVNRAPIRYLKAQETEQSQSLQGGRQASSQSQRKPPYLATGSRQTRETLSASASEQRGRYLSQGDIQGNGRKPAFSIRKIAVTSQEVGGNELRAEQTDPAYMTNWRHIRRKSPGTSYVHPAAAIAREEDQFLRGRHQREQDSKTSSYVPLSRREDAKCFLCGEVGHFKSECPQLGERIAQKSPGDDPAEPEFAVFKPLSKDRAEGPSIWQESSSQPKRTFSQPEPSRRTLETGAKDRSKGKGRRREQTRADDDEDEFDPEELAARKRQRKERKAAKNRAAATKRPSPIYLPEYISVSGLAVALRVRLEKLITKMEELGFENIHHDHVLNVENAGLVAMEYGHEPVAQGQEEIDLVAQPEPDDKSHLPTRAPVVTIMGHVDHGKTTLLDYLRKSSVAATEFGGITQHIGAFSVPMPSSNRTITFLDTPGHAAFLSMRARGANVTDIVVLVVAADDGVMPQTVEAIKHAQEASVPVIVAINKCDKEEASPERCKQDLARHGIQVEDYGGDTQAILVSGKTGQGMEDLEEAIGTLSEILDHRADPAGPIEGWILEATTRKGGRVATVLVRRGTLRQGDILVAGRTWTRVRKLCNEAGVEVVEVGPGMPIEVDGWRDQPVAGDEVLQAFNEERATEVVEFREEEVERQRLARDMDAINAARRLEQDRRQREEAATRAAKEGIDLEDECREAGPQTVPVIIKADVSGSADAVQDAVAPLGNSEVHTQVLRSGVGPVSESDVDYAAATRSLIIAFNVPLQPSVATMAEAAGVRILESNIIYRTTEKVREELSDRLAPLIKTRVVGEAEVLQQFDIGLGGRKKMRVAGCKIRNGMISRGGKVRVLRRDETVHDGIITSLKSGKKDVMEMSKGTECGLAFGAWQGFETGDQIQAYEEISEKRFV